MQYNKSIPFQEKRMVQKKEVAGEVDKKILDDLDNLDSDGLLEKVKEMKRQQKEADQLYRARKIEEEKQKGRKLGQEFWIAFYSSLAETFDDLIKNPTPEFKAWLAGENNDIPSTTDFRIECLKLLEKQAAKNGWEKTYSDLYRFSQQ
jgi:hypothetical protein